LASLERQRVAGFDVAGAVSADSPDLAAALRPIGPETFDALGVPWTRVDKAAAKNMCQGKPLDRLLGDVPVSESLGVFCDGAFVAVIVKKHGNDRWSNDLWSYGYVHAGA
jgi:tRNA pseudouridine55 synthase